MGKSQNDTQSGIIGTVDANGKFVPRTTGREVTTAPPTPTTPTTPFTPPGVTGYNTVQPFMPGFDQAGAQQLAAGFGGNPADILAAFQQFYAPMTVPRFGGGGTPGKTNDPITPLPGGEGFTPTKPTKGLIGHVIYPVDEKNFEVVTKSNGRKTIVKEVR